MWLFLYLYVMDLDNLIKAIENKYPIKLGIYKGIGGLTLSRIEVDKGYQGKGIGTDVMNLIIDFADNNQLPIALTPEKISNTPKTNLINFYKKFGFVLNRGKNKDWNFKELMVRYPKNNKIMENKIKGGKSDGKTLESIAKKHGVSVEEIEKEIKVGIKIEIEHTKDKELAREIAMDHIFEFPKYYTHPKYGLIATEKKMEKAMEESTSKSIKTLLREELDLIVADETPETVTYLIKANGKPVGNIEIASNKVDMDKYTIELRNLDLFEKYDEIKTAKEIITEVWKSFSDARTIILTPDKDAYMFWEKLGAKPLNKTYWILQRGH